MQNSDLCVVAQVLMLIAASIMSMALGHYEAGSVIILIVLMNAILGVVQVSPRVLS